MMRTLLSLSVLLGCFLSVTAQAQFTVSPVSLDLALAPGEVVIETVSLTVDPQCVRPLQVDVVASDPAALVTNLTGVVQNDCGGDTSSFDIRLVGGGQARSFDLQFMDAEFGGVFDVIPVTIKTNLGGQTGGTVPRQTVALISCRNLTSGQNVDFAVAGDKWDCEARGLRVATGDTVVQVVISIGIAE